MTRLTPLVLLALLAACGDGEAHRDSHDSTASVRSSRSASRSAAVDDAAKQQLLATVASAADTYAMAIVPETVTVTDTVTVPAPVPVTPPPVTPPPVTPPPVVVVPPALLGKVAPNMPVGARVLTSRDFISIAASTSDRVGSQGWEPVEATYPPRGTFVLGSDTGAPGSPSSFLRYVFKQGLASGNGPARAEFNLRGATGRTLFVSYWIRESQGWDQGGGHKILYFNWTGGSFILFSNGDQTRAGNPLMLEIRPNHGSFLPGYRIGANREITKGSWHLLEFAVTLSSSPQAADGRIEMWLDGSKVVDRQNAQLPGTLPWINVNASVVYGGAGGVPVPNERYVDLDHVVIANK